MNAKIDNRSLAFAIAWEVMDLKQDIEFHHMFMDEPYPVADVIKRLGEIQNQIGDLGDRFPLVKGGSGDW